MQSFASFHPPLVKRAKRLQKMGSHMIAPVRAGGWVLTVFETLLYAIIVPLLTVAGGAVLMVDRHDDWHEPDAAGSVA